MNDMNNSPSCERASDLIAFLYNEASESEARDFELHWKECAGCRQEIDSFGIVRESITAWRDEALSGFVSTPLMTPAKKKSAIAAMREFFDLSPLWLKGATGFALVTFCALAALAFINMNKTERVNVAGDPNAIYSQQDVDRMLKDALARQEASRPPEPVKEPITVAHSQQPKKTRTPVAKSRRPLSRAEREQLAAELRLLAADDDAGLNLLGDRINQ